MIDIVLDIDKKEIEKILNIDEQERKKIIEEIRKVLNKICSGNITTANKLFYENFFYTIEIYIKKLYEYLLKSVNINKDKIYSSITITNNENIKKINKDYRQIDKETDVLSFPAINKEDINKFISSLNDDEKKNENKNNSIEENIKYFGDIVISIEKIISQAREYNHSIIRELSYLIIHSFLHLLGYDHIIKEDEELMRKEEEKILSKLDIKRE